MEDIIRDIQQKLTQNRFPNEASISQGIVLRLIRALGWNVDDIDAVWPEFTIGGQRADFALCHPAGKPLVLIEVKQEGTMSPRAEEQLAAYAFQEGVSLVVLTTGQDWHFYAPYGPGPFSDRRIYRLDLMERTIAESTERLSRYLSFSAWATGNANISVHEDLREMLGKQETRRKLPEAWNSLLSEPNQQLVELLASQLEKQTGSEPRIGEVAAFLRARATSAAPTHPEQSNTRRARIQPPTPNPTAVPPESSPNRSKNTNAAGAIRLWLDGVEIPVSNHRDRFIHILEYLAKRKPNILEQLNEQARPGRRPTVAQSPEDLYPKNPDFAKTRKHAWRELKSVPGWFVDVNKSAESMIAFIEQATRLAGIRLGNEIRIR